MGLSLHRTLQLLVVGLKYDFPFSQWLVMSSLQMTLQLPVVGLKYVLFLP